MDAAMLRNFVEVQSHQAAPDESLAPLAAPQRAVPRTYPGAPQEGDSIELQRSIRSGGPAPAVSGKQNDEDLEMSRPSTPTSSPDVIEVMPSAWEPYMNRFRLAAVCLANFGGALNDSAAGALIPYMEKHYNIGYAVVSLIFVGQSLGFIFAAVFLDTLRAKLGRAKLMGLAQVLLILGFVPIVATAPFAVVACSFFFVGVGLAINVANGNTFCGSLQNGTIMLGLLHGSYGIGGTTGPLMATALVTVAHAIWSRYYLVTMGIAALALALSVWSFWNFEKEQSPLIREREKSTNPGGIWGMASTMKLRVVLLGSIFVFAYQGAEVSISGWVISFLINVRDGDPSSVGYVSAGFWAGITLGRFFLVAPAQRIGEKLFVYGLVAGALAFQVLVWTVPNIIGNAVAVSIVGLLLGPIYPCCAAVFLRGMAPSEALSGMGTISACGSLGGAVCPFLTGLLAQAVGTWVLHPIVIVLFVFMLICWYGVPSESRKSE
ncbi:Bypass of stop codon protein 6 [Paramyrothecium foliicola]|nr:Bypass of stop codon protein 6 [Paramyrothecium foliicola]